MSDAESSKNELMLADLPATEDFDSSEDWNLDRFFDPAFVEYSFSGDLVSFKPEKFEEGKL